MSTSKSDNNPLWINDPELKSIPENKLQFLNMMFSQLPPSVKSNNASPDIIKKEMIPFLLTLSKMSKEQNISFNNNEITLICKVIQKYSSSKDSEIIKKLSSFYHSQ